MPQLPNYVTSARPNPQNQRAGWLTTTAATYAGVMLWFVFWQDVPTGGQAVAGGTLSIGLLPAIIALTVAALLCHILYFMVPGLLGMKTGLPLSVVGTSTYGVTGGFLMPGLLMGLLQFGWLSVNAFFSGLLLAAPFVEGGAEKAAMTPTHLIIATVWALFAMFMGLKGIKYVGAVASFMPIIPIAILVILLVNTIGKQKDFNPADLWSLEQNTKFFSVDELTKAENNKIAKANAQLPEDLKVLDEFCKANGYVGTLGKEKQTEFKAIEGTYLKTKATTELKPATLYEKELNNPALSKQLGVFSLIAAYVIGFFATAGAAGVGICSVVRSRTAVQLGGFFGIILPTVLSGAAALIIVAGAQNIALEAGKPELLTVYKVPELFGLLLPQPLFAGLTLGDVCMFLLAVAAFPSACFCTLIAADSIKTSFPEINPWASCGVGVAAAIALVITGLAGQAGDVFTVIGASFGPICGAMAADYIMSGFKWAGPRAGFNAAGWLSWLVGFAVGGATLVVTKFLGQPMPFEIPCPPLSAFIVGFVLYAVFAVCGLQSRKLELPGRIDV
jgi:cytosine permease